ncbi:hypothetical protein N8I77_003811 [Diaporthe amygdali]|uniref:Uncharacterized protein n=1 Tax=Phomopsis amygdali TaxID=1214568 RepID=A0AAD9W5C1_PHOAM|nr:hypothetical protein N8I77_003811 [Diaporthe amygdali]
MPRYPGGAYWPYTFVHQPGGWAEQTFGAGYGSRSGRLNHDFLSPQCNGGDPNSLNGLSLDTVSSLVARLILQNHLTRLGDAGCHGGALWGCTPSPSSLASHCHGAAPVNRCLAPCVHTCPTATQPHMGTNNVFVIPANHVHQQSQMGAAGLAGLAGLGGLNNVSMFLNGLGLGLGGVSSGCGGGLNLAHGFNSPSSGAGLGAQINLNRFSCPSCNVHL